MRGYPAPAEAIQAAGERGADLTRHFARPLTREMIAHADAIYTAHRGIPTGLVSVPNRYMQSPNEMIDLKDLDRAAKLLAAFARRITTTSDFTPR